MKIMTIVGTRPEIIKLSRVMALLDRHTEHLLVHTGQNYDYELSGIFFDELGLRPPDYYLGAAGATAAETIGQVIQKADAVLAKEQPDAVLLYGDTNSCMAVIAAKRRQIPVFHMEAGNRSFDQRVPEELNRKVVDHLSDINMTLTEHARRYLIAEGLKPETIFKIGSSMKEVFVHYEQRIEASRIREELGLATERYVVVSLHREENVDDASRLSGLVASIEAIALTYDLPIIVSTHPRTRQRLMAAGIAAADPRVRFLKPLGLFDYVRLQTDAGCVVSDSGTLMEEASLLRFPAVMVRQAHERPEGMDEGTLVMSGLRQQDIVQAVGIAMSRSAAIRRANRVVADYDVDSVSDKVLNLILSYTGYVNRTVWHKSLDS